MVYPERLTLDQVSRKESANSNASWISDQSDVNGNNEENKPIEEHASASSATSAGSMGNSRQFIQDRIRHLVDAFTYRTQATRERMQMPQTPSSISSHDAVDPPPLKAKFLTDNIIYPMKIDEIGKPTRNPWVYMRQLWASKVIDPQGTIYVIWISIAALAVVYNMWVIPLRSTFPYQNRHNRIAWMFFDYLADLIYLVDMLVIQPRIMFLSEGFWMKDINFTKQNYMRQRNFKLDILALLPLDLLYFVFGPEAILLRFPRFFKMHTFWAFFDLVDKLIASPHIIRIARTLLYMMYLIHLNACAYYAFSAWEGIGTNNFVFNGVGNAYIKCFYFATKTATSIGKNPKPTQEIEFIFMTFSWLMGVFVFALLIGQIRDIIATATRSQTEYRKLVDETLEYMRRLNLPQEMQKRVQSWFNYTWETQHTLDENNIMDCLPHKMKTDIAINVYIEILSKVKLFSDCDEALLRELVLQLRSVIYLPCDTICKRGDVGKEMYIIQSGQVQVMSKEGDEVLATLTEGSVFGEISLLGIEGMTRRTADVRSHGFSNLFVLSKSDLNAALSHYPEAQELLNRKAKALMKKNEALERKKEALIVINNPQPQQPHAKLLNTVMQVMPEDSSTHRLLRYGSRGRPRTAKKDNNRRSLPSVRDLGSAEDRSTFETKVTVHRSMS